MSGEDEHPDWKDTVIELHPRVFVIDVTEDEPPDDPGPPGGPRSPPPKSPHLLTMLAVVLN